MDSNKIGNFIKELRTENNWSQEELAAKLFIVRQSVSKWENGQTIPSMSVMIKLAEIFNLTLPEIMNGEKATKDNIEEFNSNATKTMIKMHKKAKKISLMSVISILLLAFAFLGYYFFSSYKTQNIYSINGETENFKVDTGLFMITKSNIYFTVQNIVSKEDIESLTLYYLDNNERHDIYTTSEDDSIFLQEYIGYNEYFDLKNKSLYTENLYLEIKSKNYTENMKLNFRKIYENDELLLPKKQNVENNNNRKELDNKKLIDTIKSKFKENGDTFEYIINNKNEKIEMYYHLSMNVLGISENKNNIQYNWNYNLDSLFLQYNKLDIEKSEILEEDNGKINDNKEFVNEFYEIINKYILTSN